MPFVRETARVIRRRDEHTCQICNTGCVSDGSDVEWVMLDAHSLDATHRDVGMSLCSVNSGQGNNCHRKLHRVAKNGDLEGVSRGAAQLGGLDLALRMRKQGFSDIEIREILGRRRF